MNFWLKKILRGSQAMNTSFALRNPTGHAELRPGGECEQYVYIWECNYEENRNEGYPFTNLLLTQRKLNIYLRPYDQLTLTSLDAQKPVSTCRMRVEATSFIYFEILLEPIAYVALLTQLTQDKHVSLFVEIADQDFERKSAYIFDNTTDGTEINATPFTIDIDKAHLELRTHSDDA